MNSDTPAPAKDLELGPTTWIPPVWLYRGAILRPKPNLIGGKEYVVKHVSCGDSDITTKVNLVTNGLAQERNAREVIRDFEPTGQRAPTLMRNL